MPENKFNPKKLRAVDDPQTLNKGPQVELFYGVQEQ